ncbi:MAG: type II toxin-antitoxin system PemK/MazF family toxin [Nanoarchaeota archaeon]
MVNIKRGEIFLANLEPVKGSEQGGIRPVLVIQNDISNEYSPITIVAALTSKIKITKFITNIFIPKSQTGLDKDSIILLNQIKTIDKSRIIKRIGTVDNELMNKVDNAIKISLALD